MIFGGRQDQKLVFIGRQCSCQLADQGFAWELSEVEAFVFGLAEISEVDLHHFSQRFWALFTLLAEFTQFLAELRQQFVPGTAMLFNWLNVRPKKVRLLRLQFNYIEQICSFSSELSRFVGQGPSDGDCNTQGAWCRSPTNLESGSIPLLPRSRTPRARFASCQSSSSSAER